MVTTTNHGPVIPTLPPKALHAMRTFMYQTQTAVDQLTNSGIKNEIVSAQGTQLLGQYLSDLTNAYNVFLQSFINNHINGESGNDLQKSESQYQIYMQEAQNKESSYNSEVQKEQSMTGQLAKMQENAIQFGQIVDTVMSYLGNMLTGSLTG